MERVERLSRQRTPIRNEERSFREQRADQDSYRSRREQLEHIAQCSHVIALCESGSSKRSSLRIVQAHALWQLCRRDEARRAARNCLEAASSDEERSVSAKKSEK